MKNWLKQIDFALALIGYFKGDIVDCYIWISQHQRDGSLPKSTAYDLATAVAYVERKGFVLI